MAKSKKAKKQRTKKLRRFDIGDNHKEGPRVPQCFSLNNEEFKKEKHKWDEILLADAASRGEDPLNEDRTEVMNSRPVNEHVVFENFYNSYEGDGFGEDLPSPERAICSKNHILDPFVIKRLITFLDMERINLECSHEEKLNIMDALNRGDTAELPLKKNYEELSVRDFKEPISTEGERRIRADWTPNDERWVKVLNGRLVRKNSLRSYLMDLRREQDYRYPVELFPTQEKANMCIVDTATGPVLRFYVDSVDLGEVPESTRIHSKAPDRKKRPTLVPNIPVSIFENLDKKAMFEHFNIDPNPPPPVEVKEISMQEVYAIIEQLQTTGRFRSEKFERLCQLIGSNYNFRGASDVMRAEDQHKGCTESALRKFFIREFEALGYHPKGHNSKAG